MKWAEGPVDAVSLDRLLGQTGWVLLRAAIAIMVAITLVSNIVVDWLNLRESGRVQARVMAEGCSAAVAFHDIAAADDVLKALAKLPLIDAPAEAAPDAATDLISPRRSASTATAEAACSVMPPRSPWVSVLTPMLSSRRRMVATSCRRGTLVSVTGSDVSRAAHSSGKAAFLAPEIRTSPCNWRPPRMMSLSMEDQ